jgi:hypothetical protein
MSIKHIVVFDVENRDDEMALKRGLKALDMACALFDISTELRTMTKYEEELDTELLDRFHGKFYNILEDHGINLDELLR